MEALNPKYLFSRNRFSGIFRPRSTSCAHNINFYKLDMLSHALNILTDSGAMALEM